MLSLGDPLCVGMGVGAVVTMINFSSHCNYLVWVISGQDLCCLPSIQMIKLYIANLWYLFILNVL